MIESQLMPCGVVSNDVVGAFRSVRREDFVGADRRNIAYVDAAHPLGGGRALMAPLSLGRLLEAATVFPGERALVVAAGTGYSSAVLAAMGLTVVAVESDPVLAAQARTNLARTNLAGITVYENSAGDSHAGEAPYDFILVDGAVDELPQSLVAQLAEGGRVAAIVRGTDGVMRASIGRMAAGVLRFDSIAEAAAPMLPQFQKRETFRF